MDIRLFLILSLVFRVYSDGLPFFLRNDCFIRNCENLEIKHSLTNQKDACKNFYEHTCSRWILKYKKPKSEPIWNQYTVQSGKVQRRLQALIESRSDSKGNAQLFYKKCVRAGNESHMVAFRSYIQKLGSWMHEKSKRLKGYNYIEHIIMVKKLLGIHPILKFHVDIDYNNETQRALYIQTGELIYPEAFLSDSSRYKPELEVYYKWIFSTIEYVFKENSYYTLYTSVKEVINFEANLSQLTSAEANYKRITIKELSAILEDDAGILLKFLFEDTVVNANLIEEVIVNPEYLVRMKKFIRNTKPHVISNYIIWSAIKEFSRDVSPKLRNINFKVDRQLLGVSSDVSRKSECIEKVLHYFPNALLPGYIRKFFDSKSLLQVKELSKSIQHEFVDLIAANRWLDEKNRNWALERIKSVRFEIGYPQNLTDKLSQIYLPEDFFVMLLKLKRIKVRLELEELGKNVKNVKWSGHPFEVNAFYNTVQNAVILPLGILQSPFFNTVRPLEQNYGALGTLIGHELSHSLDAYNKLAPGNDTAYKKRRECFKEQYNRYGVDGRYTIGENIADYTGLKISHRAMVKAKLKDTKLNAVSHNKLFFVAFGQIWCEINEENNLYPLEEHAPVHLRVLGALKNFPEFKETYNCDKIDEICEMW